MKRAPGHHVLPTDNQQGLRGSEKLGDLARNAHLVHPGLDPSASSPNAAPVPSLHFTEHCPRTAHGMGVHSTDRRAAGGRSAGCPATREAREGAQTGRGTHSPGQLAEGGGRSPQKGS